LMDIFDAFPICAILNKQFFCVHGGLSPHIEKIEDIMTIDRFTEPSGNGPMCDLLWSDPMEDFNAPTEEKFQFNHVRGCSYFYSFRAVCEFLDRNKLLSLIRAHEAQDTGYKMHRRNDKTGFPSVMTLFSAPNYLDSYNNKGAILRYENNVINIRQFNSSPHPYYLPGFMNVFAWSIPFVAEKLAELFHAVFKLVDDETEAALEEEQRQRAILLRKKVHAVGRIFHMYKSLREEREQIILAGQLSARGDSLPSTLIPKSTTEVQSPEKVAQTLAISRQSFEGTRTIDLPNEARPPDTLENKHVATPSPESIKRHLSRDSILITKRLSHEKLKVEVVPSSTILHTELPSINEEKI